MELTQEFLKECFEHKEGLLYWKYRPIHHFNSESSQKKFNSAFAGKEAGYINKRTDSKRGGFAYRKVKISYQGNSKLLRNNRLVFLLHKGYLPDVVDHINGNPLDDRIENLRESDCQSNGMNRKPQYNKTDRGVYETKNRKTPTFKSLIYKNGKPLFLGNYRTRAHAQHAYNLAGFHLYGDVFNPNEVQGCIEHFEPEDKLKAILNQEDS